jgi:hypothetical protein
VVRWGTLVVQWGYSSGTVGVLPREMRRTDWDQRGRPRREGKYMRSQVVREVGTGASAGAGLARNAQPTACACSHTLIMQAPPPAVALPSVTCRSACRRNFGADVGESRRRQMWRVAAQTRASSACWSTGQCGVGGFWSTGQCGVRWGTAGCVVSGESRRGCAVMTNAGNLVVGAPTIDVAKVKARAGPVGRPPHCRVRVCRKARRVPRCMAGTVHSALDGWIDG